MKAFGAERVVGIMLPEEESEPESEVLARELAARYNVEVISEPITGVLDGFGCYERRNEAIRRIFPDFGSGWHAKITLPGSLLSEKTLNVFYLSEIGRASCRERV